MARTFAIGDIHGCAVELWRLIRQIDPTTGDTVVFLGDYIDRGPNSRAVIQQVRFLQEAVGPEYGINIVALKGNHEDMMVKVHDDPKLWGWWISNGGLETLDSFDGEIPADVLEWARDLPLSYECAGHFFAHAGIDPDRDYKDQDDEALLWIRSKFLASQKDFGVRVIHGHTPNDKPEVRPNRINVDTACVYGEALTCVVLEDGKHSFVQVRRAA